VSEPTQIAKRTSLCAAIIAFFGYFQPVSPTKAHGTASQLRLMCEVLDVSPSGYYEWRSRSPSLRARDNGALVDVIRQVHTGSRGTYGSPRVHAALRRQGKRCGKNRVARLMRVNGVRSKTKRRFRVNTTQSKHGAPQARRCRRHLSAVAGI
jgi:hypothetical protein